MNVVEFIIAVVLGVSITLVLILLIGIIIFQRWRISDSNAHLKAFIQENMEMRERLQRKNKNIDSPHN
jgi:hypothetical protein